MLVFQVTATESPTKAKEPANRRKLPLRLTTKVRILLDLKKNASAETRENAHIYIDITGSGTEV